MNLSKSFKSGFTLIELLVVVAIIGVLATVVLGALNDARKKGTDATVKSNLTNATKQAEIFYYTNTAAPNSYKDLCFGADTVGGAKTLQALLVGTAKALGQSNYDVDETRPPSLTVICNVDSSGTAWAIEAPLKGGGFWCIDSTGKSKSYTVTSITATDDRTCN